MTPEQKMSLESLQSAFNLATETGALDVLNDFLNDPDSINDVVDALDEAFHNS